MVFDMKLKIEKIDLYIYIYILNLFKKFIHTYLTYLKNIQYILNNID
jgi:hypothetical protein